MPNGLLGKILGVGKLESTISKLTDSSKSSTPALPSANVGQPGQAGWSPRNGVNGTTSPRGIGKWGVGA